jgi:phosphoribosyl-ATP pyrophosphohydrolase
MREFSKWVGEQVESVCQRNDTPRPGKELKPPWETQPHRDIFKKICEESSEMVEAYYNYLDCPTEKYRAELAWELADLACTAMMLSARLDPVMSGLRRGRVRV